MEFNRKSIRQIGYYTPTYSNSPNIIKRYKNDVSLFNINANTYRSELDGLNLPQFYMAENLKQYKYYKDGEQNKITNTTTVNNNENFTSSHMRINHTLDGKTQIIYETPSRTRQYWLNRRRLASANRTNDNITIITNSAVNQNINQLINKTNDPLKNKKHSISNVQFSLCGTTTIRAKTPATATPNNQCYYKTPDHKGELDHWNIEHKCMHKTKDMKLFELTENEFILSELDPRLNLNESGIILSDGKNYLNHSREYDEIPVYQPIEETNKVNVSPPTITSSTDHTWNKESSDQHNYPQHPHHHHHQQQQHKKPEYHETDSYHQTNVNRTRRRHYTLPSNSLSFSSPSTSLTLVTADKQQQLQQQRQHREDTGNTLNNNQTEISINVNHKLNNTQIFSDENDISQFRAYSKNENTLNVDGLDTQRINKIDRKANNPPALNYFNKVNSQKNHETSALHPVEQSSGIFTRKQEIIIMPNNSTKNNNNNSNKQLKDTLPQTSVTTTSQQQQQQQQQSQLSTVYAKEKSNSINVHFRQNISDNKPKCVDVRRTTPRQLKQYQSKRGHLFSSTSPPTSTTTNLTESDQKALFNHAISEKSKTTGNFHSTGGKSAHAQHQTHPGDIASSLIRTASLHLKTTLSRLKRSNSGHTSKSLDNSMHTTTTTTNTTTISNTNKTTTADDETSLRRSSMPYDQKSIKSITKYYERQSSNDGDDLSPGCTKWSTRLGPPPPCTLSTPIVASSIHRNTCPKCTASMVTYATTITTVSAGTRAPVSENKDPSLSHPYTSTTTTTTTTNVSSAFYSLPTCESNEISLLADDCIDFGTLGRINFRTGSFMGRYPNYSRSNQLQQYSRGQNISHIQHHQQQQPQPQRLADYRPLYLSVQPQTSSSSGNTTRSAPSPSLSSITSTQGVLVLSSSSPGGSCHHQESSYQHQQNKPVALKTSSTSSITLAGSSSRSSRNYSLHYPQTGDSSGVVIGDRGVEDYSIPVQHEDILSASRRNPNRELDPILARLLSDVTSIDEYRSSLQPHGSITPPSTSSSSIHRKRNTAAHQKHSPMLTAASSDPDSISRSAENLSIQQNIMDDIWDLNKQIGDLIQMEFHYKQRKPTTTSTTTTTPKTVSAMKKYQSSPHGTLLSGSRSSAPNVRVEENKTPADVKIKQSTDDASPTVQPIKPGKYTSPRKHPFRWSSRSRPSHKKMVLMHTQSASGGDASHYLTGKEDNSTYQSSGSLQQQQQQQQSTPVKSILNTNNGNNYNVITPIYSSPIISSTASSGLHQPTLSSRMVNNAEIILHDSKSEYDEAAEYTSFWSLSVGQLTILRKLALIQLASLAEKHCSINRSPFSWRFIKYRALLSSGDSNLLANSLITSPLSDKKPFSNSNDETCAARLNSIEPNSIISQQNERIITQLPTHHNVSYSGPVFGQSLSSWQRRLGYPLPPAVVHMMDHLEMNGTTAHGIFRRPGGKLRMLALREEIERDINWKKFDDWQPYDIADLLKQFFRELPECLFTSKLATVLVNVYVCVPNSVQIDLLRWILISLPDENRIVLQKLLYLLNHLSRHSDVTEMSASNLAVCFAPSLYRLIKPPTLSNQGVSLSPRRLRRTTSGPDPKDLADQRAAQLSLSAMINLAPNLFQISCSLLNHSTLLTSLTPIPQDLETIIANGDWPQWIQTSLTDLIRECSSSKSKGWNVINREAMKCYGVDSGANELLDGFEVHYKKIPNSSETKTTPNTLRLWRCSLHIPESNPRTILNRFCEDRTSWDPEVLQMKIIDQISDCVELCEVHLAYTYPQPKCVLHLIRGIQHTLDDGCCAMLSESITNTSFPNVNTSFCVQSTTTPTTTTTITAIGTGTPGMNPCGNSILGHVYEDHVYIRPSNDGQGCRVYLLSRIDLKWVLAFLLVFMNLRGYGPDWYINQWGHTLCRRLVNLKRSFQKSKPLPVLVYELDESVNRPSPPPYATITTTTSTTIDDNSQIIPTTIETSSTPTLSGVTTTTTTTTTKTATTTVVINRF